MNQHPQTALPVALPSAPLPIKTIAASGPLQIYNSGKVLPMGLPFSEMVRHGNTLYLSGQIGILPGTTTLAPGGIQAQARQTMENISATLAAHGYSMKNLVNCVVMLADMSEWQAFNDVYQTYFTGYFPARSAFAASGLAFDARVEVTCVGAVDIE